MITLQLYRRHRPLHRHARNPHNLRHLRLLPADHPRRRHPRPQRQGAPVPRLHTRLFRGLAGRHQLVPAGQRGEGQEAEGVLPDQGRAAEDAAARPEGRAGDFGQGEHAREVGHCGLLLGREGECSSRVSDFRTPGQILATHYLLSEPLSGWKG